MTAFVDSQPRASHQTALARLTRPPIHIDSRPGLAASTRDAAWHDELMRAQWKPIHRVLRRRVSVTDDAEDLAQSTFLIAWAKRDKVPEPAFPWLFVVARNLVLHYHRHRLGHHRWSAIVPLDDEAELAAPAARDRFAAMLARDEAEYLLGLLTPGQRQVLRHVYLHERTPRETAHLLGMSVEAVHQQLSRGLRAARAAADAEHRRNGMR